jgi:hypothetical protein
VDVSRSNTNYDEWSTISLASNVRRSVKMPDLLERVAIRFGCQHGVTSSTQVVYFDKVRTGRRFDAVNPATNSALD